MDDRRSDWSERCAANGFNLADDACDEVLHDIAHFREFCGFDHLFVSI